MNFKTAIATIGALSLALGSGAAFAATTSTSSTAPKGSAMATHPALAKPTTKLATASCKSLTGKKLADCQAKAKAPAKRS